ncbi:glycosyltransferase family 2 protein [Geotalea sp. SG265]|uniref:glycosyltransferase family 2 protein n=1 Tax=Geotalea sp. SG265 TaxID=2922867 RepID=UPI001FAF4ECD|nr:glycosyltransferase family 2 protein [Geotalea sp. SG265]
MNISPRVKITVVTVSYNAEKTISYTLESVAMQNYLNIEHIVIDGGSTDSTLNIVKAASPPIAKVISEKDNGLYDAMNKGISMATGDVIGFINADDFYPSAHVLSEVAELFQNPQINSCYGDLCYVKQDNPEQVVRYWKSSPVPPNAFVSSWVPPHPTFFVRRHVYEKLGGFNLDFKIAADFELMLRFLNVAKISTYYIPKTLVHMRLGGTTNRSLRNIWLQNLEIVNALKLHGYTPSLPSFVFRKTLSRGKQFFAKGA